jgi:tRNA A37 threonylcarbamoyladenosine modification protein TsaB
VVGDGVSHYADAIIAAGCAVDEALLPSARGVLQLALHAFANGDVVDTTAALPVYLQGTRPWRKLAE